MSKFKNKKTIPRYKVIAILLTFITFIILAKATWIMTAEKHYWMEVSALQKQDSLPIIPIRGNILSADGKLMASSLPEFKLYVDFQAIKESKKDTAFIDSINYISKGLNHIFPTKKASAFKTDLLKAFKEKKRHFPIWTERVDYNTFKSVQRLPIFKLPKYVSGFHWEEFNSRRKPFGSLADRTIGDLYGAKDLARCGLELSYDSILRGINGIKNRRKVRNKYLSITEIPPINGSDIITTIDVSIQDLAERALREELEKDKGYTGVAMVMEVATGDIKAIVNLDKCEDGVYREIKNHAVSDLLEPGSVFKTASIMVALDDGVVDTNFVVNTGCGTWDMYGRKMKDHNWKKGGYGSLTLPWCLKYSSNIGVSRIIDMFYHKHPEDFVKGIYRLGLADDLKIPIVGYSSAKIKMPKKNSHGQYTNWSATDLPWMSIGYVTQVPPISTLTFYNAIANGGKLMLPRFVKQIEKDGKVIADIPPVVGRERIAKKSTLTQITRILSEVVSEGLGKRAGSDKFTVAGKTGTAQMSKGAAGYKSGIVNYLVSFVGFFPVENPRYSCIVCIQKSGLPASGGLMSGAVFHQIAEGVMAKSLKLSVTDARDSVSSLFPTIKYGNLLATDYVLSSLGFNIKNGWDGNYPFGYPIWGKTIEKNNSYSLIRNRFLPNRVPDVHNMGARDAVYLLESKGIKVILSGRGKVKTQSLPPGDFIRKGMICKLKLE